MKKILYVLGWLLIGLNIGFAQSETTIRPGGAIYDVSTGSFLGHTNYKTGAEETLASTIASGLSATSVVCTNASKVLTSTCSSATPSFGATTVTTLNGHTFTAGTSTFTGTAGQTYTFPSTSATLARTDSPTFDVGLITKTNAGATDSLWLASGSTSTGANYFRLVNTGGTYEQGIENSGASLYGVTAYDYFQAVPTGKGYSIFVGGTGVVGRFISTGLNSTAIGATTPSTGAFTSLTSSSAPVLTGSNTNDSAAAGKIGELLTVTVASGSAVSLTTATSANIATLSVTAGDWDCSAQVTHNAAATTSVTLLQIGISATTATLPTQAGGSGIGTDPLAIWRQAAAVPGGALTTNVGPVRVSLSGTTNIFLVANDTFTVSTMTGYGTLRCRRMR